jgi:hypothetical protein
MLRARHRDSIGVWFVAQVELGELSFTLDQRPRWNRARPGHYGSGPVAQAIDVRGVAARTRRQLASLEQRGGGGGGGGGGAGRPSSLLLHPIRAAEVDWILHQIEQLPVQSYRTVRRRRQSSSSSSSSVTCHRRRRRDALLGRCACYVLGTATQ